MKIGKVYNFNFFFFAVDFSALFSFFNYNLVDCSLFVQLFIILESRCFDHKVLSADIFGSFNWFVKIISIAYKKCEYNSSFFLEKFLLLNYR